MTTRIESVEWKSARGNSEGWAASISCDFATETDYEINFANNVSDQSFAPTPKWIYVDNLTANTVCRIGYGPYSFAVLAFSQNKFLIPNGVRKLIVAGTSGNVTIYLTELDTAPNAQYDQRAAIADANPVDYSFLFYNASRTQLETDSGKSIVFAPTAADMDYNLIDTGTTLLKNGSVSFLKNLGTKNVNIRPALLGSINGFWTNATPIVLAPGDRITLSTDGADFYADGELTKELLIRAAPLNAGYPYTVAHGMQRRPDVIQYYIQCIIADANYQVGDLVDLTNVATIAGGQGINYYAALSCDDTNVYAAVFNGIPIIIFNKTTNAQVTINNARWNLIARTKYRV